MRIKLSLLGEPDFSCDRFNLYHEPTFCIKAGDHCYAISEDTYNYYMQQCTKHDTKAMQQLCLKNIKKFNSPDLKKFWTNAYIHYRDLDI